MIVLGKTVNVVVDVLTGNVVVLIVVDCADNELGIDIIMTTRKGTINENIHFRIF